MRPLSKGAAEVLSLIQWFAKRGKICFARQQWFADKIGCTVRTIKRYFKELREAGFLATKLNGCKAAIHTVLKQLLSPRMSPQIPKMSPQKGSLLNTMNFKYLNQHNGCAAPEKPNRYPHSALYRRFMDQYPGQMSDLAAQLFLSVVVSQDQADLFARNFTLYLQCDQWRRGIRPSAENFLSKGLWKYEPPKDPEYSKPKSSLERWLESA